MPDDADQATGKRKLRAQNQTSMKKNRVLILGGGFGGLYTALEFEKLSDPDFEVTLISQDNFLPLYPDVT